MCFIRCMTNLRISVFRGFSKIFSIFPAGLSDGTVEVLRIESPWTLYGNTKNKWSHEFFLFSVNLVEWVFVVLQSQKNMFVIKKLSERLLEKRKWGSSPIMIVLTVTNCWWDRFESNFRISEMRLALNAEKQWRFNALAVMEQSLRPDMIMPKKVEMAELPTETEHVGSDPEPEWVEMELKWARRRRRRGEWLSIRLAPSSEAVVFLFSFFQNVLPSSSSILQILRSKRKGVWGWCSTFQNSWSTHWIYSTHSTWIKTQNFKMYRA